MVAPRAERWHPCAMRRVLFIVVGVALLAVIGAGLAAITWGPGLVEDELRRRASARGWRVEWRSMALGAGPVEFEGVRLSRGAVGVVVDRLAVVPRWSALGEGMPVERVELAGVRVEVDLDGIDGIDGTRGAPVDGMNATNGIDRSGISAIDGNPRPDRLPPVSLHRLHVIARHGGRVVGEAKADAARWLPGEPDPLRLDAASLWVETEHGRLDAPPQPVQLDPARRSLQAGGTVALQPGLPPQIPVPPIELAGMTLEWTDSGPRLGARVAGGEVTVTLDGPLTAPEWLHVAVFDIDLAVLAPRIAVDAAIGGRLDATLAVARPLDRRAPIAMQVNVREGTLAHAAVAAEPLDGIAGELHAIAERAGGDWHVIWQATTGGVSARGTLDADRFDGTAHLRLRAAVDPVACDTAYAALPRALRGPYADARFEGRFAPTLDLDLPLSDAFDLRFRPTGIADACPVVALEAALSPPALLDRGRRKRGLRRGIERDVMWLLEDFSHPVAAEPGLDRVGPGDESFVELDALPPYVPAVMWLSEDRSVFERPGALDMKLLSRALKFNFQRGRYVYGGSTLPQQLVKNLFLGREKTLARKLQEAVIANRVTVVVPPDRILALYVNCIEFAPGVYGLRRAAWHYFGVGPEALSPKQAVFLATAKPSPLYAETLRKRGVTPDTPHYRRYMRRLFDRLVEIGALTEDDVIAEGPLSVTFP